MKALFTLVLLFVGLFTYSQQKNLIQDKGVTETEILKGSVQKLFSECGYGNSSIKQTVTTYIFPKTKKLYYKVETILWLQYTDEESYNCFGSWGYEIFSTNKLALGETSLKEEKSQQALKAFELLNYLQEEGNH